MTRRIIAAAAALIAVVACALAARRALREIAGLFDDMAVIPGWGDFTDEDDDGN